MKINPQGIVYAPYYQPYIEKVQEDALALLTSQDGAYAAFIAENADRLDYAYAEGKWSIREVVVHVCDAEQIFANRLLRIVRGDSSPLPGFDQDAYIHDGLAPVTAAQLTRRFHHLRGATLSILDSIRSSDLDCLGTASGQSVSGSGQLLILIGHAQHHLNILRERYM